MKYFNDKNYHTLVIRNDCSDKLREVEFDPEIVGVFDLGKRYNNKEPKLVSLNFHKLLYSPEDAENFHSCFEFRLLSKKHNLNKKVGEIVAVNDDCEFIGIIIDRKSDVRESAYKQIYSLYGGDFF